MILRELIAKIGFKVDSSGLRDVQQGIDSINAKLNIMMGYELVKRMVAVTNEFSAWGQQLLITSQNMGIATDSIQKLQIAGMKMGVESGTITSAMSSLTKSIYAAKMGSEGAWISFTRLGISPEKVLGWKNAEAGLYDIADAANKIKDPIQKAALLAQVMGGAGEQMATFLSQGGAAIKDAGAKAAAMGLIVTEPQLRAMERLRATYMLTGRFIEKFWGDLTVMLAPALEKIVGNVINWYMANEKLIKTNMKHWFEAILYAMGYVVGVIEGLIMWYKRLADSHGVDREHWMTNATKVVLYSVAILYVIDKIMKFVTMIEKAIKFSGMLWGAMKWFLTLPLLAAAFMSKLTLSLAGLTQAFPALSGALLNLAVLFEGLTMGAMAGFGLLIAGVVMSVQSLFALATGKPTWYSQLWEMAEKIPYIGAAFKKIRELSDIAVDKFAESALGRWLVDSMDAFKAWITSGKVVADTIGFIWSKLFPETNQPESPKPVNMNGGGVLAPGLQSAAGGLNAFQNLNSSSPGFSAATPGAGLGGQTSQVNNITINVPSSMDKDSATKFVTKALSDSLLNLNRGLRRDVASPVTH